MIRAATSLILFLLNAPVGTETVDLRESGTVDLGTFECRDITRSTIIQRVCYDAAARSMIVGIESGYDRYCRVPAATFAGLMAAPSMGQFFNRSIRALAPDGRYDCRAKVPQGLPATPDQSVSIAPTSASATTVPSTLASP